MTTKIRIADSLRKVSREEWQLLAGTNPFVSYDFLSLLESTGCATPATGWAMQYVLLERDGELVGAAPAYMKSHSRGEFVFDQAWAQAFERYGIPYYPKLVVSVPFTPVTGPRLLVRDAQAGSELAKALVSLAVRAKVSSVHVLFANDIDKELLERTGFLIRETVQFHWTNAGYGSMDQFLASMSHDKRKKIKQDRKHVAREGILFRWLTGSELSLNHLSFFYSCYERTYREHWSTPYLSFEFFQRLHEQCPNILMLVLAERNGVHVACALNILGDDCLYGRYWGTSEFISGLHFEACYMQSIEFCIQRGLKLFEGGAQGEHKMARGLLPVRTSSAHWIADRRFASAIEEFLDRETSAVGEYVEQLETSSPFRRQGSQGDVG